MATKTTQKTPPVINKNGAEKTPCDGAVTYTPTKDKSVIVKVAATRPGAMCPGCALSPICSRLAPKDNLPTILVKAFTGMAIGDLPIIKDTPTHLEVRANNGQTLRFEKKTGAQVNAKNPRYANKIDPIS